MNYRNAKEVRAAARDLMAEHHAHLLGLRVECLFTDKTAKSKGREIPGRVKKVSGFSAYLTLAAGGFPDFYTEEPLDLFVLEVSEEVWEAMKERQRVALVDHLLSQCEIETDEETGDAKLSVISPDVSAFSAVVARHGLWTEELRDFAEVGAEQLSLIEYGVPVAGKLEVVR